MPKINAHKTFTYTGHKDCIYGLGKGFEPNTFVTGGADGWVVEWDYANPTDGKLLVQVNAPIYSFLLLRDDKKILCGSRAGNLHSIDMQARKEERNIEAHTAGIFDIALINNKIVTAAGDGKVKVWEKDTYTLLAELSHSNKSARVIAKHPTLPEMAVGYSDNTIRIFNTENFKLLLELKAHDNSVFALAYSPDGKYLLSGGRDAVLKIWEVNEAYRLQQTINAHWYHINAIKYSPNGNFFATVSMDKTVKIWEAENFELIKVLDKEKYDGHTTSVNKILWVNDNELISCSDDKTAMLWKISI
jgi:WD40 repeat protein